MYSIRMRKGIDYMTKFSKRFLRLYDLVEPPIPGDRVRVTGRPRNSELKGKGGIVKAIWIGAKVEIDGQEYELMDGSLTVIEGEK